MAELYRPSFTVALFILPRVREFLVASLKLITETYNCLRETLMLVGNTTVFESSNRQISLKYEKCKVSDDLWYITSVQGLKVRVNLFFNK